MTILLVDANNVAMRRCATCDEEKPNTEFYKHAARKDGLQRECKACHRARADAWRKANPEKVRAIQARHRPKRDKARDAERVREYTYLTRYGITVEEYEERLEQQNGCCAICLEECASGQRLAVDHDHHTGKIRGLLCAHCNRSLGGFRDSIDLLNSAIKYLKEAA